MKLLRKLLSILLLFGLSLPFASALLGAGVVPGSGLPMCCRRGGMHECGMKMAGIATAADGGVRMGAPAQRCPWRSVLGTAPHSDVFAVAAFYPIAGEALARASLPAALPRKWTRIESSRTSRGPPFPISL